MSEQTWAHLDSIAFTVMAAVVAIVWLVLRHRQK